MPADILNLPDFKVQLVEEADHDYRVYAEVSNPPGDCTAWPAQRLSPELLFRRCASPNVDNQFLNELLGPTVRWRHAMIYLFPISIVLMIFLLLISNSLSRILVYSLGWYIGDAPDLFHLIYFIGFLFLGCLVGTVVWWSGENLFSNDDSA